MCPPLSSGLEEKAGTVLMRNNGKEAPEMLDTKAEITLVFIKSMMPKTDRIT